MSLYDELGLSPDASADEINAAYRKAAKHHHPDAGGDPETFARIGRAVAVLRDPDKRAEYAATGREDFATDDPDRQARDVLMQAFAGMMMQIVEQGCGAQVDVLAAVRASLIEQGRQQQQELREMEAMQERARDALGRLVRKGNGPDVLGDMLSAKIDEMDKIKARMVRLVAAFKRAAEMAMDWDWRVDEAPAPLFPELLFRAGAVQGGTTRTWTMGEAR